LQEICPERETIFKTLTLSRATMTRRVEDINSDSTYATKKPKTRI